MRFIVLVKATDQSEAGVLPDSKSLESMRAFNEGLANAGVLLAAEGLQPSAKGSRLKFGVGRPSVTDGPFAETKELVAGFWMIQANSKDEAVARFAQCPFENGEEIELRQIYEAEDFGHAFTPEMRAQEQELRASMPANDAAPGRNAR